MSQPVEFEITLERTGVTATVLKPPFNVQQVFGAKGGVLVRGTIDGVPFRTQLFPIGDGTHYMVVNREMKAQIRKDAGDTVRVVMQVDTEPRTVEVPEDFAAALAENADAEAKFDALSVSHRREYIKWIEDAKKPETRARRIMQAVEMIAAGEKRK